MMQHVTHRATSQGNLTAERETEGSGRLQSVYAGCRQARSVGKLLQLPTQERKVVEEGACLCVEVTVVNSYSIYKEQTQKRGERVTTHLGYRRQLIEFLSEPIRNNAVPHPCKLGRTSLHSTWSACNPFVTSSRRVTNAETVLCAAVESTGQQGV